MTTATTPLPARSPRTTVIAIAIVAVTVLLVGLAVGWSRANRTAPASIGTELPGGVPAPTLALRSTDGATFDLAQRFRGRVTLLYLGYLNCPDACPITMDVLSRTLATAPSAVRAQVQVVFVTTDPDRDRPEDIRTYLDRFDPSFVGLTATPEDLERLQAALLAPSAVREPAGEDGDYLVGHATSVYVFDPDAVARYRYPFGTRQSDWERIISEHTDA